nr:stalk domain-containing protein [Paenibacillus oenotherae]
MFVFNSGLSLAHSGRTDGNGGHNCSEKSRAKGLCTGYHYHNGGSGGNSGSSGSSSSSGSGGKHSGSTNSTKAAVKEKVILNQSPPTPYCTFVKDQYVKTTTTQIIYQRDWKCIPQTKVKIKANDEVLQLEGLIIDGTTYFTAKQVVAALDADIEVVNGTYTFEREDKRIVISPNSKTAVVNHTAVALTKSPKIYNAMLFVPASFFKEAFQANVVWDASLKEYTIQSAIKGIITDILAHNRVAIKFGNNVISYYLFGIETSTVKHRLNELAELYLEQTLLNQMVTIEFDQARIMNSSNWAYVKFNGELMNRTLIHRGYSKFEDSAADRVIKYRTELKSAENEAQARQSGVWSKLGVYAVEGEGVNSSIVAGAIREERIESDTPAILLQLHNEKDYLRLLTLSEDGIKHVVERHITRNSSIDWDPSFVYTIIFKYNDILITESVYTPGLNTIITTVQEHVTIDDTL